MSVILKLFKGMEGEFLKRVPAMVVYRVYGEEKPFSYVFRLYMIEIQFHDLHFTLSQAAVELRLANDLVIFAFSNSRTFHWLKMVNVELVDIRLPVILSEATIDNSPGSQEIVVRNICRTP